MFLHLDLFCSPCFLLCVACYAQVYEHWMVLMMLPPHCPTFEHHIIPMTVASSTCSALYSSSCVIHLFSFETRHRFPLKWSLSWCPQSDGKHPLILAATAALVGGSQRHRKSTLVVWVSPKFWWMLA